MTPIDTSTPVLAFKMARGPLDHGVLGVTRTCGRLGIPVYAMHGDAAVPEARSRYGREPFVWEGPDASEEEAAARLHDLGDRIGRKAVLVPLDDAGAAIVDAHADALEDRFVFQRQPPGLLRSLSSKKQMHFLCRDHGVDSADSVLPQSRDDVVRYGETGAFPVVAKQDEPALAGHHASGATLGIVPEPNALLSLYDGLSPSQQRNLMLQEYIPGGPETVWMFNGYFDGRGECLVGFTGRKLRQFPAYTGVTSLGVCVPNETVARTTKRLMRTVGYRGVLDIGFRYDERDGKYKLLDVNPRVGSTFRLFAGDNGVDVVRALYLDLTGQRVPAARQPNGRKWIVEPWDPLSSLTYARDGSLSLWGWLRSLRGIEEGAWFARDDPIPFVAAGAFLARKAVARAMRRRTRRRQPIEVRRWAIRQH